MRSSGNALSEYGIVLTLVGVATIGALAMLGVSLTGALDSVRSGYDNAQTRMAALSARPPAGNNNPAPAANSSGGNFRNTQFSQTRLCYGQDRLCVDVPVIPPNATIATAGTNGSDVVAGFVDVLNQIAGQLEKDPSADPSVIQLIRDMSAKGYNISDELKILETECPNQNCPFDVNVAQYKSTPVRSANYNFRKSWDSFREYMVAHPEALPTGVNRLIETEATQISRFGSDSTTIENGATLYINATPRFLVEQSAESICNQGGGGDCRAQ